MMNKYMYCIIIPHKNTPDLLIRCVASIPQRDDVQVIVVDDDNGENTNEGIEDNKEDAQQAQAAPGMSATNFPASPVDCIEYILHDQPLVEDICTDYKISPSALKDWLELFAEESRCKGKITYDNYEDLLDYLHYWLIKVSHQ